MDTIEAKQFVEHQLAHTIGLDMTQYHNKLKFEEAFNHCIAAMYVQRDYAVVSSTLRGMYVIGVDLMQFTDEDGSANSLLQFEYADRMALPNRMQSRYGY